MSAIAGIVCLKKNDKVSSEELVPMLDAMKAGLSSKLDIEVIPECSAVLGRVSYGFDADYVPRKRASDKEPRLFWTGELYNDDAGNCGNYGDYILERYRKNRLEDFAQGLRGSFSLVIVDPSTGSVNLVTDHIASNTLFAVVHRDRFYFASEVKGLLAIPNFTVRPDLLAALSLAACGFFVDRRTLVENVSEVDYATICHIKDGKIRSWPYWRYYVEPESDRGRKTYIKELAPLLCQAVRRCVREGKCAIMLSGGVDSRGILACMENPRQIKAITHTLRTKQTRHNLSDWAVAEKVAEMLGAELSVFQADPNDFIAALRQSAYYSDGASGFIYENVWGEISKKTNIEFLITGDECMGWRTGLLSNKQLLPCVHVHSVKKLAQLQALLRKDIKDFLIDQSQEQLQAIVNNCHAHLTNDRVDEIYLSQRIFHFVNPKRRVIARHGFGIRQPWLDMDILNFIRKLPASYRLSKNLFRDTLAYLNYDLFKLPRSREFESVNYHKYLVEGERDRKAVSKVIFDNNPFVEELFNISALRTLVDAVCKVTDEAPNEKHFKPLTLLPMGLRERLAATYRYLVNPAPHLSGTALLLRIMTVAEALKQLNNRFASIDTDNCSRGS